VWSSVYAQANYGAVFRDYPQAQLAQQERPGGKQENLPTVSTNLGPAKFPFLGQWQPSGPVLYYYPGQGYQLLPSTNFGPVAFPKLGQYQPSGPVQYYYPAQGFQPLVSLNFPIPFAPLGSWWPHAYDGPDSTAVWQRDARGRLVPLPPVAALYFPPVPYPPLPLPSWVYWQQVIPVNVLVAAIVSDAARWDQVTWHPFQGFTR
jgi:hypothetical protein